MDFSIEEIQKYRTSGSIMATTNSLKDIPTEKLISDMFISVDTQIQKDLIRRFETMLVKTSLDSSYMKNNLHDFFVETNHYLKENNLYQDFSDFAYFVYNSLKLKGVDTDVLAAYLNLLLQQYCYIAKPGYSVYGIDTSGNPIVMNETHPLLDLVFYEMDKLKKPSSNFVLKQFRKKGYKVKDMDDVFLIASDEQVLNNMVLSMVSFIDENHLDIIGNIANFQSPSDKILGTRFWKETKVYKDLLMKRRYTIPSSGVVGEYSNAGDIKTLLFKEICKNDQIYMLYRLTLVNEKSMYGVYDTKYRNFYSLYTDSSVDITYGSAIENFVLESYCHLTTDIEIDRKRNMALKTVDVLNKDYYPNQPIVKFTHNLSSQESTPKKDGSRLFDKRRYKEENISVSPFIRNLPVGAIASDEAIERAKSFGYELEDGETFVRSFERKSYVLKV